MRVSFNQPAFIPWGGFYGRLLHSDLMILLDRTQFTRGFTFVNRNRLKGPQGEIWVTVPIRKKRLGLQKINQLRLARAESWGYKFLSLLRHYYGHSPYYEQTIADLGRILKEAGDNFLRLAVQTSGLLADYFGLRTPFRLQSELGLELKGTELLVELALRVGASEVLLPYLADRHLNLEAFKRAGLKVIYLKYDQVPYPQFWGHFIENLSAVDLWLCCGPEGLRNIKRSSRLLLAAAKDFSES
ncbi:MAG: WbqC family protein [Candidatus Aminicenantes bacterium]|nr:WbqC family protein [Candidatus Aminicenantes bacterium]